MRGSTHPRQGELKLQKLQTHARNLSYVKFSEEGVPFAVHAIEEVSFENDVPLEPASRSKRAPGRRQEVRILVQAGLQRRTNPSLNTSLYTFIDNQ